LLSPLYSLFLLALSTLSRHYLGDHWASMGLMKALKQRTYPFESQHFAAYRSADIHNATLVAFLREVKHQAFG
jgi:hypothetical protein